MKRWWCALAATCLIAPFALGAEEPAGGSGVDAAREAVGRWIETQRLIYQERRDWQQGREVLQARVALAEKEIADLEARLEEARKSANESGARKSEAEVARRALLDDTQHVATALRGFEEDVLGLQELLPDPLRQKVDPLCHRIPPDPATTRISVAERLQNVIGVLNEVDKANSEITVASEVRSFTEGRPVEVKTVYLGLGGAYYLGAGSVAGTGRPGPDGWVWEPAPELAPRILEVLEIIQGKAQPKFVSLPVRIDGGASP